ncbi:MAG TPA: HD domain-containing phosphohydrolase, partial [Candidatus Polarisedimenticolaceae bacterium]|nr:HD domain-containing phosphohydrolase [Candidatus Polarisedimenticolaceae bacterium]
VLHGPGAAIAARAASWLVARGSRADHARRFFHLAAGCAGTLLASLGYLAVGGTVPFAGGTGGWVGVCAFAALWTAADRVSRALEAELPVSAPVVDDWPGWRRGALTHGAGALLGGALASTHALLGGKAWWALPTVLLAFWLLPRLAPQRRSATRRTGPVDRAIARAIAISLADEKPPPVRARRLCRVALDLGRSVQMTGTELDALELAAWLTDLERLEPPPPPRHWPEARRFAAPMPARFDPRSVMDAIGLPASVQEMVVHVGERWDGTGGPDGLCGARIPLGARVLAVARDFVSMTTPTHDRHALTRQRTLAELRGEAGRAFDPRIVDALANDIGGRRVRAHDETSDRREHDDTPPLRGKPDGERLSEVRYELDALYGIRGCGKLPVDLDETLVLILEKLKGLVPHVTASVWLFDPEHDELHPRFVRGEGEATLRATTLPAERSFSGRVAQRRRTATFHSGGPASDLAFDLDGLADDPALAPLRTALAAPLVTAGGCRGALTLYGRAGHRFDTAERRALVAVAAHVAEAVETAKTRSRPALDSLTDPLTGLPNGRYLEIFAADLAPETSQAGFGLLGFRIHDLDRVYELCGVAAGERLLGVLARRLAAHCVPSEVPVRYGHDLFLVLSPIGAQHELVRRWDSLLRATEGSAIELRAGQFHRPRLASAHASCPDDGAGLDALLDVLGTRLGLAFDRGHKIVPFRAMRSAG